MLEPQLHPNQYSPELEEAHADLLATIAASRELGPDMDTALAASYLQRHAAIKSRGRQRGIIAQRTPNAMPIDITFVMRTALPVIALVAFLALLLLSHGGFFWLFWLPFAFGGWRRFGGPDRHAHNGGSRGSRGTPHYDRERAYDERPDQRRDDRYDYI